MLLSVLLFLLPFQTQYILRLGQLNGQTWEYGTIGLFAVEVLLLGAIVGALMRMRWLTPPSIVAWIFRTLGILGTWALMVLVFAGLSIIFSSDRLVSTAHLIWLIEAMLLGWLVATYPHRRKLLSSFIVGSCVQSFLGLWQFFAQATSASTLLGIAVHPAWQGGSSVIEMEGQRWLRAYGGLPHPNVFGGWMAVAIVVLLSQYFLSKPALRSFSEGGLLSSLVLLSAGLAVSFSRSAWIAATFGIVTLLLLSLRGMTSGHPSHRLGRDSARCGDLPPAERDRQDRSDSGQAGMTTRLLCSVVVVLLSISAILLPYRSLLTTRLESSARLEQQSFGQRKQQYGQAWELIRKQRFCKACPGANGGISGIGNYTAAVSWAHPELPVWNIQPVHNVFVLIASEMHTIGLLLFLMFFYIASKRAFGLKYLARWRVHWRGIGKDQRTHLPIALLMTMTPILLLDHYLWSLHVGLLLSGFLFGILAKKNA